MRELAREADLRRLGAAYAWMPVRLMPSPAPLGDVDDPPAGARASCRAPRPATEERAGHVDVEDRLPVGRRDLLERPADLAEHAAGVVDQDVDLAGGALDLGDERLHRCAVAHVDAARRQASPHSAARFRQPVGEDVAGPDLGAARRERQRDGAAEAVRRAGDDDGAAVEVDDSCSGGAHGRVSLELVQQGRARAALAVLDLVDQRDERGS